MGLAASQARFLELTKRKSDNEYQSQQICFERMQITKNVQDAATEYEEKMSNKKIVYRFNNGNGPTSVDLTYSNYKDYINQQAEGLTTSQEKLYLTTSGGKKIVVGSEEEMAKMMENDSSLTIDSFSIEEDLNNVDHFQEAIRNGKYCFSKRVFNDETELYEFQPSSWDIAGNGAFVEEYDTSDDAAAQAKYDARLTELERVDKAYQMELDKNSTEHTAIQTELEGLDKIIEDNIKNTYNTFG